MKNWSVCVSIRLRQREVRRKKRSRLKKEGEKKEESGRQQRKCRLRERSKVDPGKSGQEEVAVQGRGEELMGAQRRGVKRC